MRISDSPRDNTILTTGCAKMTEESRGRHGVNGNDGGGAKEEGARSAYGQGGRLKFFKGEAVWGSTSDPVDPLLCVLVFGCFRGLLSIVLSAVGLAFESCWICFHHIDCFIGSNVTCRI